MSSALQKLVKEYRPSMDSDVLHSWAADVVATLKSSPVEAVAVKGDLAAEIGARIEELLSEERRGAFIGLHQVRAIQEIEDRIRSAPLSNPEAPAAPVGVSEREFTNELGNRIKITIEGPSSSAENIVTKMEAEKLRDVLVADLGLPEVIKIRLSNLEDRLREAATRADTAEIRLSAALVATPPAPTSAVDGEVVKALRNLTNRTENFWALIQGEYGVRLSSEDQDDHNVYEFFAALEAANAALSAQAVPAAMGGTGDNASLIEEYRNLVKSGAEYAASELKLAPTSVFEIYIGHFRDIGRVIEAALAGTPSLPSGGEKSS